MAEQNKAKRSGYLTVTALVITSFIPLSLGLSCAGIFYPYVAEDLGVGTGVMSYYTSFIWLSATLFLSLEGRLLQKFDARVMLSAAVALMALVFVWLSFAQALWQFYVGGFAMGLGIGMLLFLAPSTLINRWFAKRAGFLLGIVMAFTGVGGVVFSSVGGSLILQIGWSATYRVFAALCALTLLATVFMVSNDPASKGLRPVGADASSSGESLAEDARERTAAQRQALSSKDVSADQAFKMPVFFLILGMVFLLNFGMYVYFIIPSYINSMEISTVMPLLGATASSVAMAGQTISKLVFGFVGDRYPHACVAVGLAFGVVGVLLMASFVQSPVVVYLAALTFGVYYGVTNVMSPLVTRLNFGDADYPRIYSRISTGAAVANMVSALIWGAVIDLTGGFTAVLLGVAVLLAATMVITLLVKRQGVNARAL